MLFIKKFLKKISRFFSSQSIDDIKFPKINFSGLTKEQGLDELHLYVTACIVDMAKKNLMVFILRNEHLSKLLKIKKEEIDFSIFDSNALNFKVYFSKYLNEERCKKAFWAFSIYFLSEVFLIYLKIGFSDKELQKLEAEFKDLTQMPNEIYEQIELYDPDYARRIVPLESLGRQVIEPFFGKDFFKLMEMLPALAELLTFKPLLLHYVNNLIEQYMMEYVTEFS